MYIGCNMGLMAEKRKRQQEKKSKPSEGTIHILRKHLYSKKLNLTAFFRQNKTVSFYILHFDEILIL